ncbi:MAG: cation-transporting P-type ATPase, partial [Clostridia bacterium]|nr:cation-transporting P-type ATPase [Clostridia bacterium]
EEAYRTMAGQALRVRAVAYKYTDDTVTDIDASHECDMTLAGLIALADQARDDSVLAIKECGHVGIITVMMTGDNEETACAVAKQLGILHDETQVLTGDQLHEMSEDELKQSIGIYRVFARITPEDKEHIIRAWQARGAVVAATGNELADVPALQSADIGCATGAVDCDMTRNESDLTLYDNSFATLVTAIKQARGIYANIRKALQYTITCGFSLLVACFITLLAYKHFALSAASMALFFFIGLLCSLAMVYEAGDRHTLSEKPRRGLKRLMPGHAWIETLWQGALTGVCAYLAYDMGLSGAPDSMSETAFGMTTAFIMLMFSRLWMMLASHRHDPRRLRVSNRVMPVVFVIATVLTVLPVALPMVGVHFGLTSVGFSNWLLGLLLSAIPALTIIVIRFVSQLLTTVRRGE